MCYRSSLVLAAALLAPTTVSAQTPFVYQTLPPMPGDLSSIPSAINAHGDVVGRSFTAARVSVATLWIDGIPQSLGTLAGTVHSYAEAINQYREVVGVSLPAGSLDYRAWIWDPVAGMRELLAPAPFLHPFVADINDSGLIVGMVSDPAGLFFSQIAVWDRAGNATVIGAPPGYPVGGPGRTNRFGEICFTAASLSFGSAGFRWDAVNGFRSLPPLVSGSTTAGFIDDAGRVFGSDVTSGELVVWDGFVPTALGKGWNGQGADCGGLNEQGWALSSGSTVEGDQIYENGVFRKLLDFVPTSVGSDAAWGGAVADSGLISGSSTRNGKLGEGFLLVPPARIEIDGGQIGGTIAFRHVAPTFPGKIVATLVSLTGMAGSFHVGRGTHVRLDFDIATSILLGFPGIGILTLDGSGRATTAAIDIDNDPALVGLPGFACSVVFQGGKTPPVGSTTVPFILE